MFSVVMSELYHKIPVGWEDWFRAQAGKAAVRKIQTSDTNPLRVDFVSREWMAPIPGKLGMTIAPGKKDLAGWTAPHDRSLQKDLDRLFKVYKPDVLVSLMETFEYEAFKIPTLLKAFKDRGAETLHFPIRDVAVPTNMPRFVELVDTLNARLWDGKTVVVHCKGGLGRTGLVVAAALVRMNYTSEDAIDITRETRKGTIQTREQERFVSEFEMTLYGADGGV